MTTLDLTSPVAANQLAAGAFCSVKMITPPLSETSTSVLSQQQTSVLSQQQASVLSQQQTSVLSQQKKSILSQQKTRQLLASGWLL